MDDISSKRLNRIQKTKLNATVVLGTSIFVSVLSFAERTVFNRCFIADYLGLYSFYTNLIGVLDTVELGITSAIAFALYAPLDQKDEEQIAAIMHFYKRIYAAIGTLILCIGIGIIPFLPNLVITEIPMQDVKFYYIFFLLKSVAYYYFGYKNILFSANQEQYKIVFVTNSAWSVLYVIEMVIAITTQSFLFYVMSIFGIGMVRLLVLNHWGSRDYRYLKRYRKSKISPHTRKMILKNAKGLVVIKLSSVVVTITDSLLISAMIGTAFLGRYTNYTMITSGVNSISTLLPGAVTASIGNAGVTETKRTLSKNFEVLNLSSYLMYGFLTILLLNISTPIVETFFGKDKAMPFLSVLLVCFNFYLSNQRALLGTFKESLGLFWADTKRPVIEGITNLVTSIILGIYLGFDGIIIGTIITNLFVNLAIEPRIIFHYGLRSSTVGYYLHSAGRLLLTALIAAICLFANSFIPFSGILEILIKTAVTAAITILSFCIAYRKDPDIKIITGTIRTAFRRKKRK